MKKLFNINLIIFLLSSFVTYSQRRYLDPMFAVKRTADIIYGNNIGVLTGAPVAEDLLLDLYEPVGDVKTDRPIIFIAHTGSFLPVIFNQQTTGSRTDSTVVNCAVRLASMGYVVAAYTYRLGWNPNGDQDTRTGTLLQAAYRGIQDTRTCIRFFKKSVAENNNPYGIDPGKMCVWGIGTGGYLALGAGSLNDFGEVQLPKFISQQTLKPYVDSTILGNIYGTSQAAICKPNHLGYSSNFQLSVNLGGAIGDSSWMDGDAVEPAYIGVHCVNDFFAPYFHGNVIVPTTREFVVEVSGTRKAIEIANNLGVNKSINNIAPAQDPLYTLIENQKNTPVKLALTGQNIILGTNNFYGFNLPPVQGSPWDWWDLNTLRAVVGFVNQRYMTSYNADTLHRGGLQSNPDMSPEKGKRYLDTIFALVLPRLCYGLNLGCSFVGINEVKPSEVGLQVFPNPFNNSTEISTDYLNPIESIYVYDLNGKLVKAHTEINSSKFILYRNQLNVGHYFVQARLKNSYAYQKIVISE